MRGEKPLFVSRGEWFLLSAYPKRKNRGETRIAVPRKLYPLSVSRNRLRRQIREVVRLAGDDERDCVITVQKKGTPPFSIIRKEIETHFKKGKNHCSNDFS